MLDYLKKGMFMGLGMATMTKDRVESMVNEMRKYADISEEEGRKMADYLAEESKKTQKDMAQMIQSMVDSAVAKMPCVRRVEQMEERLRAVEEKVGLRTPPVSAEGTSAPTDPSDACGCGDGSCKV